MDNSDLSKAATDALRLIESLNKETLSDHQLSTDSAAREDVRSEGLRELDLHIQAVLNAVPVEHLEHSKTILQLVETIGGMKWAARAAGEAIKALADTLPEHHYSPIRSIALLVLEEVSVLIGEERRAAADSQTINKWAHRAFLFSMIETMRESYNKRQIAMSNLPRRQKRAVGARVHLHNRRKESTAQFRRFVRESYSRLLDGKVPRQNVALLIHWELREQGYRVTEKTVRNTITRLKMLGQLPSS